MRAIDELREISAALRGCDIKEFSREAESIITSCTGVGRVAIYRDNPVLSDMEQEAVMKALKRRMLKEPLQYILGHVEFYGLKIKVGQGVLIPRPESELIVEEVIRAVKSRRSIAESGNFPGVSGLSDPGASGNWMPKILDLCTGSGCLALAVGREFGDSRVSAVDFSEKTLDYARENAEANGIKNVIFLKGDLFDPVKEEGFDIIVSNPPYIKRASIISLSPEIREWEPLEALDGGEDGLEFYRRILSCAAEHLDEHGFLIFELGYGAAREVGEIAKKSGFRPVSVIKDYSGIERVLSLVLS